MIDVLRAYSSGFVLIAKDDSTNDVIGELSFVVSDALSEYSFIRTMQKGMLKASDAARTKLMIGSPTILTDEVGPECKKRIEAYNKESDEKRESLLGSIQHGIIKQIAIKPEYQKKGIASFMMRIVENVCDEFGIPCWMEIISKQYEHSYQKYGFDKVGESHIKTDNENGFGPLIYLVRKSTLAEQDNVKASANVNAVSDENKEDAIYEINSKIDKVDLEE